MIDPKATGPIDRAELVAELRRRRVVSDGVEVNMPEDYIDGYRDALGELIEFLGEDPHPLEPA